DNRHSDGSFGCVVTTSQPGTIRCRRGPSTPTGILVACCWVPAFAGVDEFGCRQDLLTASYAGVTKTPRLRTKKSGHRITVTRPSFLNVPRRSRKPQADRVAGGYRPAGVRMMSPDGSPWNFEIYTDPGEAGVSSVIVLCDAKVWPPCAAHESART